LASSVSSLNSEQYDSDNIPTTPRPFATSSNNNSTQNLRQNAASTSRTYSKEETLVNIIQANPEGKFVVFSKLDSSYWGCMNRLRTERVSYSLLRGNSNVMTSVLDNFKNGNTRVLLLNTVHAASGIDISCATDLILVHDLGTGRTQAVGRCNRHPRNTALRIHQLCYPHEINS
jgi:superfamily II DNA/RNA helicase